MRELSTYALSNSQEDGTLGLVFGQGLELGPGLGLTSDLHGLRIWVLLCRDSAVVHTQFECVCACACACACACVCVCVGVFVFVCVCVRSLSFCLCLMVFLAGTSLIKPCSLRLSLAGVSEELPEDPLKRTRANVGA